MLAFNFFQKNDRIPAVIAESINNAKNFTYSSFLCLLSLSNVRPIESYYPIKGNEAANIYEKLFNYSVKPRTTELPLQTSQQQSLHIFRCASMPVDYVFTNEFPKNKDHFVPLMIVAKEESPVFSLPLLFKEKKRLLLSNQPAIPLNPSSQVSFDKPSPQALSLTESPQLISFTSAHHGKKRKQLTLANYAVKAPRPSCESAVPPEVEPCPVGRLSDANKDSTATTDPLQSAMKVFQVKLLLTKFCLVCKMSLGI